MDDYLPNRPLATFVAYDQSELDVYSHAIGYSLALYDVEQVVRSINKYELESITKYQILDKIMNAISNAKIEYHLPED